MENGCNTIKFFYMSKLNIKFLFFENKNTESDGEDAILNNAFLI